MSIFGACQRLVRTRSIVVLLLDRYFFSLIAAFACTKLYLEAQLGASVRETAVQQLRERRKMNVLRRGNQAVWFLIVVTLVAHCAGPQVAGWRVDAVDGTATNSVDELLYQNDFNDDPLGTYTVDLLNEDWRNPPWENGVSEGRVEIVDGPKALEGRSMRVRYPAGRHGDGAKWRLEFEQPYEELYLSYWVRFDDNFNFVRGGKLPGFCGGECNTGGHVPDGTDGWSARMMWRGDGEVEQYVYHPDQPGQWGESLHWDDGGYQRFFVPGQWHHLIHRVVMNTPGQRDGIIQGWFDGELALDARNLRFRDVDRFAIDELAISTFFGGGDSSWAPDEDEYICFDNFVISTERGDQPLTPVPTNTPSPSELIIDDSDSGFSTTFSQDAWREYTDADGQHHGATHYFNAQTGSGEDFARWSFTVSQSGRYEIYAWWWEGSWRPTDVPYTIDHLNGSTTVRVNQQANGGQWNSLGTFAFQGRGSVSVSDDVSTGDDLVADAVRIAYSGSLLPRAVYLPVVARY
jgi:hypothetical protein